MAISTIRRFTDEDAARVAAAAERFCKARNIQPNMLWDGHSDSDTPCYVSAVEEWVNANEHYYGDRAGVRAWRRAFARALGERESVNLTTAYGYVGHRVS